MRKLQMEAVKHLAYIRRQRIWKWAVAGLACLVVFCTAYALVLPAVTLERSAECGLEEHEHSAACYTLLAENYNCDIDVHQHTDDCYDFDGNEICGYADFVLHQHDELCYDQDGNLVCPLEEKTSYDLPQITPPMEDAVFPEMDTELDNATPSALDFELLDDWFFGGRDTAGYDAHQHDESCYDADGRLICGLLEVQRHQHSLACLTDAALTCGMEEHVHSAACMPEYEAPEEEQAQVEAVIALIDALPAQAEIEEILTALEEAGDEEGYDAYLTQLVAQAKAAYEAYAALTEEQQQQVANADKLLALEPLWSIQMLPENNSTGEATRLLAYAEENRGKVDITISDSGGSNLSPDPSGSYDVVAGETYTVRVAYTGDLLAQGRYYVTFASNIDLTQRGNLTFKDNQGAEIEAGEWYFEQKEDGVAWLVFDISGDLGNHSNIVLLADVTCKFDYADKPVTFDGNITVNIKHNESSPETKVSKWAKSWSSDDPKTIEWRSEIYGNSGSRIIGNTITDSITTIDTHHYTEKDMKHGIEFEANRYRTDSSFTSDNCEESHYWTAKPGDVGLTWTETGWSYTMPEQITCTVCRRTITLGNDDWLYYIKYTSTVQEDLDDGYISYKNSIACDGDEATGKITSGGTESNATVIKTGVYKHNPTTNTTNDTNNLYANDTIDWTITVRIPGAVENSKYDYYWHLWDSMTVKNGNEEVKWDNPLQNITVKAKIGKREYTVPNYEDLKNGASTSGCPICWRNTYSGPSEEDPKIYPGQEISFYSKCTCTEATCVNWEKDACAGKHGEFCECWCIPEDVEITVQYSTPAGDLTTTYGGRSAELVNDVDLNNCQLNPSAGKKFISKKIAEDGDAVPIPGVFTKQLTESPESNNGYLAEYTITVNEGMADLSTMQSLTINDTMTKTLGFLSTTLKITAESADGNSRQLQESIDYSISYETQEANELVITLNKNALGPYKYTLIYDASVHGSGDIGAQYKNDAEVKLFGRTYEVKGGAVNVPSAAISAETYGATLFKCDKAEPDKGLEGATFGLYTEEGVLLHQYTTGEKGIVQVETNPADGVVLHPHVLYYLQEITAPAGYQLDGTKHYFWFCNNNEEIACSKSNEFGLQPYNGICVYSKTTKPDKIDLTITNEAIKGYELPQTGGVGTKGYLMTGMLLVAVSAMLLYQRGVRRKEES